MKIIATVKFNKHEAYVLNRMPKFEYTMVNQTHLHAQDGIFHSVYKKMPSTHGKAFAGREFYLPLRCGGEIHCNGQWWDAGHGYISEKLSLSLVTAIYSTEERLKECYVFSGSTADAVGLAKLRAEYEGPVYAYRDYEKVLKYDDQRIQLYTRIWELEKQNKSLRENARSDVIYLRKRIDALITEVKKKDYQLKRLATLISPHEQV